jgi:hypothetical protein
MSTRRFAIIILLAAGVPVVAILVSVEAWEHEQHCRQLSDQYSAALNSQDPRVRFGVASTAQSLRNEYVAQCNP